MKIGDKVKIIGGHYPDGRLWDSAFGKTGTIIDKGMIDSFDWKVQITNGGDYFFSEDELQLDDELPAINETIRTFPGGATRDTDKGKLNYLKALSPLVLQRYVQYLDKHRLQSNGEYRDWDNWKLGIDKQTYRESRLRHEIAAWLLHEGYSVFDNHGPVSISDSLCAIIFNAMGDLHELLKEELCGNQKNKKKNISKDIINKTKKK